MDILAAQLPRTSGGALMLYDVRYGYPELLRWLRDYGEVVAPRGMATRELVGVTVALTPHYPLATGITRGISLQLISVEALQLIAGLSYPQRTVAAAPDMARFLDGEAFHGAYGPRLCAQLTAAVKVLEHDPDSRQALMTIWDPVQDLFNPRVARDQPCTALLHLLIRNHKLVLHTTMRSNDAWWGFPHDIGQFTQLQLAVARILGLEAGLYYHHADSFHLYERDLERIDELTAPDGHAERLEGIGEYQSSIADVQDRARLLLDGDTTLRLVGGEYWHRRQQWLIDEKLRKQRL